MTLDQLDKEIQFYEEQKQLACDDNAGHCETCVLCIETVSGNVCPYDVILQNI